MRILLVIILIAGALTMEGKIINIADYGAKAVPGFDNYHAIAQAVSHLGDGDSLIMREGIYEVHSKNLPSSERIFEIIGRKNVTVDGCNSTILLCSMARANTFYFENCLNPTLKNVAVDLQTPPFTQGKVVAADENSLTIKIDPGYFLPDMNNIKSMYDFDEKTRYIIGNFDADIKRMEKIEKLDDCHIKLTFKKMNDPKKMDSFPFSMKNALTSLMCFKSSIDYKDYHVDFVKSENILIDNVKLYAGAQMGIHVSSSKNLTVRNTQIIRKPGTGRLLSVNYDAMHIVYMKGKIDITGSTFAASGDDGININCGKYLGITGVNVTDNSVDTFKATMGYQGEKPMVNEIMRVIDKDTYETIGNLTVKSARWNAAEKSFKIVFKEDVKMLSKTRHLLFNTAYIPEAVRIYNCTFESMRGRGVCLSVGNLTIEKCKFIYTSYSALMIIGMTWRQAISGDNILIKDNYFKGMAGSAIYMNAHDMYNNELLKPVAFNHVKVINNIIEEENLLYPRRLKSFTKKYPYWSGAMFFSSVDDLTVAENKISGFDCAIFLTADKNIAIERNCTDAGAFLLLDQATVSVLKSDMKIKEFNDRDFDKSEYYIQNFN